MCHGAIGGAVKTKVSADRRSRGRAGGLLWLIAASSTALSACSAGSSGPPPAGTVGGASGFVGSGGGAGGPLLTIRADGGSTGFTGIGNAGTGGAPSGLGPDGGSSSSRTPISIDGCSAGNAGGVSTEDVQKLMAASTSGSMRWLYPYDGTVFPRGLKAPLLMWDDGTTTVPTAVYVHVHSNLFDYKGCLVPSAAGQLQLPEDVWDAAGTRTLGASDPFDVELTTLSGGTATGPITEKLVIAQATINGSIYYNTYNSLTGGGLGGAIVRIVPGKDAEFFLRPLACTGCHSVSTSGTRLIARELTSLDNGQVYNLTPTTAANPTPARAGVSTAFVGLSPDGSMYVTNAQRAGLGPEINGGVPALADVDAVAYETDTGAVIADTGIPTSAMMLTFSPDGSLVVYNDYAAGQGHGLSVAAFDRASRKASLAKQLYTDPQNFLGWPFFLPDNRAVVFAAGASGQFSGAGTGIVPFIPGPTSDLWLADVGSGSASILAQAMGFKSAQDAASGTTYLPFGAEDIHHVYYPTVSPVAAGGYIWVFFDSMRHYGNRGVARQLWGTALTLSADGKYTQDPSHPAFYLGGQQFETANHRAFTALDPCKQEGASCNTGVDCCKGFCTNHVCGIPDMPRCSQTSEACKTSADCCDPRERCVNGFCSTLIQ
jgi:hypothetical protein